MNIISITHTILFLPGLELMMRCIRARTEHFARLRARRQRMTDAIVHYQHTCQHKRIGSEVEKLTFEEIPHCSGGVIELNLPNPLLNPINTARA